MAIKVRLKPELINQLRKAEGPVLAALTPLTRKHAGMTLEVARILAPEGEEDTDGKPPLKSTTFIDGPRVNDRKLSVSTTAGFDHPAAGAIHEGWHWGDQVFKQPTHFMKKAHRNTRRSFAPAVRAAVKKTLKSLFGQAAK